MPLDVPLDGLAVAALRLAATFALAELSYRLVEQPVRHGALERAWAALRSAEGMRRYQLGARCGLWQAWFENGSPDYQGAYVCNWSTPDEFVSLPNGLWTSWFASGQKRQEGTYREGLKIGVWTEWDEQGHATVSRYDDFGNPA